MVDTRWEYIKNDYSFFEIVTMSAALKLKTST